MSRKVYKTEFLVPKNDIFERVRDVLIGFRNRDLIEIAPALVFEDGVSITITYDSAFITLGRIMVDMENSISHYERIKNIHIISNIAFPVPDCIKSSEKRITFNPFGIKSDYIYSLKYNTTEFEF